MKGNTEKHLEFIQSVVNRLAGNSFLIKGWAITIWSAGFGLYFEKGNWRILIILLIASSLFWFMDTYYLVQERLFRKLYEAVAKGKEKENYSLSTKPYKVDSFSKTLFSFPTGLPYALVVTFTIIWLVVSQRETTYPFFISIFR